ncbi:MAG TPA: hypothetical protein VMT46_08225 [Anaerolineaceae bacterium]|nr:hypothetical protein [Anaerolineaceae bacterium]
MGDLFERVTADQDIFKQILSKVPGFSGYIERSNRRASDKLVRETIASRFEEIWQHISSLQRDLISQGGIAYIDDLEAAALKIRQVIDRIKTASYGYAGLFDAVKINEAELSNLYRYDLAMLELVDKVNGAVDNVEASLGTDGLPAAIRNLTMEARQCVETFDRRTEAILGSSTSPKQAGAQ